MGISRGWIRFLALTVVVGGGAIARSEDVPSEVTEGKPASAPTSVTLPVPLQVPVPVPAAVPVPKDPFGDQIERAIQVTSQRRLTAGVHTPWQVVHGILAQRWDLAMLKKENPKEEVSGIEWITSGVYFDGEPLWQATPYGGRGHPYTRPYAFEGHPTQFMGYMTMANIPLQYEVRTPTKIITIADIVKDAKMQVHTGVEITWTLWTLAHYEEPDAQWFNAAGEPWSIERLVKMQVDEPVTSGACGGCHGLFALAYARNMWLSWERDRTGKTPVPRGVWFEADQKIKRYIYEARALQNADGSFSTNHFAGPGYSDDFATRITTSGHQLEWLMIALPQSKLKEEWIRKAIANVAKDLIDNRHVASDCGPLFHGMHALVVYRQRTVPGYLVPQFNSHIKLSERGKKKPTAEELAKKARKTAPAAVEKTGEKTVEKIAEKVKEKVSEKTADNTVKTTDKPGDVPVAKTVEKTTDAKPVEKKLTEAPVVTPAGEAAKTSPADANASTKAETDTTKK
ncbi:MAG TPA: hypothetical protein VGH74_00355 [Planctomycetaceae bacterium]|jgi:hypothetical protein